MDGGKEEHEFQEQNLNYIDLWQDSVVNFEVDFLLG